MAFCKNRALFARIIILFRSVSSLRAAPLRGSFWNSVGVLLFLNPFEDFLSKGKDYIKVFVLRFASFGYNNKVMVLPRTITPRTSNKTSNKKLRLLAKIMVFPLSRFRWRKTATDALVLLLFFSIRTSSVSTRPLSRSNKKRPKRMASFSKRMTMTGNDSLFVSRERLERERDLNLRWNDSFSDWHAIEEDEDERSIRRG